MMRKPGIWPMHDAATNDMRLRPMTAAEYRGFNYALDMMITWATQLERAAHVMPVTGITIPLEKQQINAARQCRSLARALKQGVACGAAPEQAPEQAPGHSQCNGRR